MLGRKLIGRAKPGRDSSEVNNARAGMSLMEAIRAKNTVIQKRMNIRSEREFFDGRAINTSAKKIKE
jgi:hypothetical protein